MNGSTVTANLLTGGIDEYFTRTDSGGTSNFLTDALGSTIALTDTSGNSQVEYSYGPFGNINITGTTNNTYTYTGRETDGLGVYYYRARYYNPTTGRFISEDPLGFLSGINGYVYVDDDPMDFNDPFGMDKNAPPPSPPPQNCSASPGPSDTEKRFKQAGKGLLNLGIGVGKMAGGIALAVGTDGLGAGVGYYSLVSSFGNLGAGVSQLAGAASGNVEGGEQGAQVSAVVFSPVGMTTLLATGGNIQTASTAASVEGIVATPATVLVTGEAPAWYDWADLALNANDLVHQPGNCP